MSVLRRTTTPLSRLVLDGQDVLEVFFYSDHETAGVEASRLAGGNPRLDVFHRGGLVVVRANYREGVARATYHTILGRAL